MKKKYNIWIMAGETSGDRYGAKLADSLMKQRSFKISVSGMGGAAMKKAGVDILVDSTELGVVGIIEALRHVFTFIWIFLKLVRKAKKDRPNAVVLINYPGFNLLFAKKMYKLGIPVIWYISPHVWVWKKNRIYKLARYCSKMLVIFPFEVEIYKRAKLDTEFVGHPLVDLVNEKMDLSIKQNPDNLLLLPGSRSAEIERCLWPMLKTASILKERHPNLNIKISAARPSLEKRIKEIVGIYSKKIPNAPNFDIVPQSTQLLQECGTAIAKSGTVTVECAIMRIPSVVFYKLNPLTFFLARCFTLSRTATDVRKKLFRGSFVMPNIIANQAIYQEFLQEEAKPEKLAEAVETILPGGPLRKKTLDKVNDLIDNKLTLDKTNASVNAKNAIIRMLQNTQK